MNQVFTGQELKRLLKRFRLVPLENCNCDYQADLMDEKGPDWCLENIEIVTDWLEEAAVKRNLPFMRTAAKILIRRAVKNARRKAKFFQH